MWEVAVYSLSGQYRGTCIHSRGVFVAGLSLRGGPVPSAGCRLEEDYQVPLHTFPQFLMSEVPLYICHIQGYRATYRGTSLTRNSALLGLYSRTIPRALRWS